MNQELYSFYDKTAKHYKRPMMIVNMGKAMQVFSDLVNATEQQSDIAKWPEQFNLVKIAEFNEQTGQVIALETPEIICNGMDVQQDKNKVMTLNMLFQMFEEYQESKVNNVTPIRGEK
jgi:hypothetical protein